MEKNRRSKGIHSRMFYGKVLHSSCIISKLKSLGFESDDSSDEEGFLRWRDLYPPICIPPTDESNSDDSETVCDKSVCNEAGGTTEELAENGQMFVDEALSSPIKQWPTSDIQQPNPPQHSCNKSKTLKNTLVEVNSTLWTECGPPCMTDCSSKELMVKTNRSPEKLLVMNTPENSMIKRNKKKVSPLTCRTSEKEEAWDSDDELPIKCFKSGPSGTVLTSPHEKRPASTQLSCSDMKDSENQDVNIKVKLMKPQVMGKCNKMKGAGSKQSQKESCFSKNKRKSGKLVPIHSTRMNLSSSENGKTKGKTKRKSRLTCRTSEDAWDSDDELPLKCSKSGSCGTVLTSPLEQRPESTQLPCIDMRGNQDPNIKVKLMEPQVLGKCKKIKDAGSKGSKKESCLSKNKGKLNKLVPIHSTPMNSSSSENGKTKRKTKRKSRLTCRTSEDAWDSDDELPLKCSKSGSCGTVLTSPLEQRPDSRQLPCMDMKGNQDPNIKVKLMEPQVLGKCKKIKDAGSKGSKKEPRLSENKRKLGKLVPIHSTPLHSSSLEWSSDDDLSLTRPNYLWDSTPSVMLAQGSMNSETVKDSDKNDDFSLKTRSVSSKSPKEPEEPSSSREPQPLEPEMPMTPILYENILPDFDENKDLPFMTPHASGSGGIGGVVSRLQDYNDLEGQATISPIQEKTVSPGKENINNVELSQETFANFEGILKTSAIRSPLHDYNKSPTQDAHYSNESSNLQNADIQPLQSPIFHSSTSKACDTQSVPIRKRSLVQFRNTSEKRKTITQPNVVKVRTKSDFELRTKKTKVVNRRLLMSVKDVSTQEIDSHSISSKSKELNLASSPVVPSPLAPNAKKNVEPTSEVSEEILNLEQRDELLNSPTQEQLTLSAVNSSSMSKEPSGSSLQRRLRQGIFDREKPYETSARQSSSTIGVKASELLTTGTPPSHLHDLRKRTVGTVKIPDGSEWEDSDSSGSDESGDENFCPSNLNKVRCAVVHDGKTASEEEESANSADEDNPEVTTQSECTFFWEKGDLPEKVIDDVHHLANTLKFPVDYFDYFFDNDLLDLMVDQTNLNSVQKDGTSMKVTKKEIQTFFGICIYMGIARLPSYLDYWNSHMRVPQVADYMTLKRFQKLRTYLHFADSQHPPEDDRLWKVRPLLSHLQQKCLSLEQSESKFSVDESMVPYKGKKAGNLRQYIKNKPHKWGFKFYLLTGISGIVYNFLPYTGSDTFNRLNLTEEECLLNVGPKVVVSLSKAITHPRISMVCFDNFFTSMSLITYLKVKFHLLSIGTIRSNRFKGATLESDKELKKRGRGSFDVAVCKKNEVAVVKWFDNKIVHVASSIVGAAQTCSVQRWDKTSKRKLDVECPRAVSVYNKSMGGVDFFDMLCELYRPSSRSRRWYLPIVMYMLNLSLVNAWLLYRRDALAIGEKKILTSKEFRLEVYSSLVACSKKRGRPSTEEPCLKKQHHSPITPRPTDAVRTDGKDHVPEWSDKKGKCRNCSGCFTTFVKCKKCGVFLCFVPSRNCFAQYHAHD